MLQINMFDYLKSVEAQASKIQYSNNNNYSDLDIGIWVYKVILGEVISGRIVSSWDLGDKIGYSVNYGPEHFVFCSSELNNTVFLDKSEAYRIAEEQGQLYKMIKLDELVVIKERNFVEICADSRICISATVKLLQNYMVYYSLWYQYPFLEVCKSEKEAEKVYSKHLKTITDALNCDMRFEVNIPVEMTNMYLAENGLWSHYEYVSRHNPVIKEDKIEVD